VSSWNKAQFPNKDFSIIMGATSRLSNKNAAAQRVRVTGANVKLTISGGRLTISNAALSED
jgi:hypothetical protein